MVASLAILYLFVTSSARYALTVNCDLEFNADGVGAIMYDDDDCCELLITREFRHYLTDTKTSSHFQINLPGEDCHFLCCLECDGSPPKELIFQSKKNDTIWAYVYSGSHLAKKFKTISGSDTRKPDEWDAWLTKACMIDCNGDGHKDILFTAAACFDLQPRGLWAYDITNNRELWSFWMGAFPNNLHVLDVNNDTTEEIVVSTTAVANGSNRNGFDDHLSYVIVFNNKGIVLWYREIGGAFADTRCHPSDLDGDGTIEIVAVECEGPAQIEEPNQILILDGSRGYTKKFIRSGEKYLGVVICDLNRDEKQEIIAGNTDGILRVYDHNLNLINSKDFGLPITALDAADFNGDGVHEIIIAQADKKIVIADEYLNSVAECQSSHGDNNYVCRLKEGRKARFIIGSGQDPATFSVMSIGGPSIGTMLTRQTSPALFAVIIILILIIVYFGIQYKRMSDKISQRERYTGRILEWSGLAQRLAHEIKNPLSTINLTLQRVQEICESKFGTEAQSLRTYTNSILEEIERVRETVDKFMKILSAEQSNPEPRDINLILNGILKRLGPNLPVDVQIKKAFTKDLPLINCDETQMHTAFSNIVDNALAAIGEKGILTIRTSLLEKIAGGRISQFAEIIFEDTGMGIPKKKLQYLFKPFNSSKPGGTGLGLAIAKTIVEAHHGSIDVASKVKVGTTVTITLPVSGNNNEK